MKKLVCSAIALTMTSAAGFASDGEWSALDQEVGALTSSLSLDDHGPSVFGRVRTYYTSQSDASVSDGDGGSTTGDIGGVDLENVRLGVKGSHGDYGYKFQSEWKGGAGALLDAYVTFGIGDSVNAMMGQFKTGVAASALVSSGNLLFRDRSAIGDAFKNRHAGLQLSGDMEMIGWSIGLMNGADGNQDEMLTAIRLSADLMGDGANSVQGCYGGPEDLGATLSVAMVEDGGVDDSDATVIEFTAGSNVWSVAVETADVGAGGSPAATAGTALTGDTSPLAVTGSYMMQPGKWELALRFEDLDDAGGSERMDLAVNNYLDGHGLKWMIDYSSHSADTGDDADTISIGVQVAF